MANKTGRLEIRVDESLLEAIDAFGCVNLKTKNRAATARELIKRGLRDDNSALNDSAKVTLTLLSQICQHLGVLQHIDLKALIDVCEKSPSDIRGLLLRK